MIVRILLPSLFVLGACGAREPDPPPAEPAKEGPAGPTVQLYDVRDLVRNPGLTVEQALEAVRAGVEPESWEQKGVSLEARQTVLVVKASPEVHEKIAAFLKARRDKALSDR